MTSHTEIYIYKKGHQGSNPGGHHFVVLNVSINNTPVFVSAVVQSETAQNIFNSILSPTVW